MASDPNTPNNAFASNGGGAAFGNPNITRQAQLSTSGATTVGTGAGAGRGFVNPAVVDPNSAPPNAASAATKTNEVFNGLVTALNSYQQDLVKQKKYQYPDVYEIQFAPADLANSLVKKPGELDKTKTAMQSNSTAKNVIDPNTNAVDVNSRGWQVTAGTQIVQLIDQIMRSSSYITNQQLQQVNSDGIATPNQNNTSGNTAWYKISVAAQQLQYDNLRHDHAYHMTYTITPYAINQAASDFFPNSQYRGSHKSYNYWFTGLNSQILHFEQEYNNLYRLVISGIAPDIKRNSTVDFRDQFRRTALAASGIHTQGADGYTNEPADNLADFLYSPTDQAKCHLRIVGDPAWMQQGEVGAGIGPATNFSFQPFNADGGINYDSQQIVFDISWNRPVDYDLSTGIMNVNANNNQYGQPQDNLTYTAIKCKNIFSRGRFEQEIEGRQLIEFNKTQQSTADQIANGRNSDAGAGQSSSAFAAGDPRRVDLARTGGGASSSAFAAIDPRRLDLNSGNNPTSTVTNQVAPSNAGTQPAAPPDPPTSTGGIGSTNGDTPADQIAGQNTSDTSQQIAQDD